MLMYYREYRTYEHIGMSYGISESRVYEIVQVMESINSRQAISFAR